MPKQEFELSISTWKDAQNHLTIREMQIKTTNENHFTLTRMARIFLKRTTASVGEEENQNLHSLLVRSFPFRIQSGPQSVKHWAIILSCSVTSNSLRPMDCSPPGSSVRGISQARKRVGCHFLLQGSSRPRDWTHISCISCIGGWILYQWATWKDRVIISPSNSTPRYLPQRSVNKSIQMCTWAVRAALFIIEKKWEQPQCPTTDMWIKWGICIQ